MKTRLLKLASVCLVVTGLIAFASWQPVKAVQATSTTSVALVRLGTASLSGPAGGGGDFGDSLNDFTRAGDSDSEVNRRIPATSNAPARVPADHVPTPASNAIASNNPGLLGFNGLTHFDQRFAGTGAYSNTQFSLEPPDQGLCVGHGFVVETVNTAVRVRTTSGVSLTAAVPLNQFFGLSPEVVRSAPPVYGDFTSDPKCYYDAALGRFFLTVLQISVDPPTGNFTDSSSVLIAVSKTSDPTAQWYTFKLNTTNDGKGTPKHTGCPCFGDQPLIGADANGFYVTTNEFPLFQDGFNGAQVYAMSKSSLAAGVLPTVVLFEGPIALAEGVAYSVQPATTPPGGAFASAAGGTEYFMSSLEFTGSLDNRIAVWALTNTGSLNDRAPHVALSYVVVGSEVYGMPIPAAEQADGPRPLGDQLKAKVEFLDPNDDRMNQVVYAAGKLFSGVNTVVKTENAPARAGIAYFIVTPAVSSRGVLSASMFNQGYVSVNRAHVIFPAVAVNNTGLGAITFTLTALDRYPSAAYVTLDRHGVAGDVHIAAAGVEPEDGFTGYAAYGGNRVARWGDYSAATVDETGRIWMAVEFIPGGRRSAIANWGTYIASLTP